MAKNRSSASPYLNLERELQKLYARRSAVDNLIQSLEQYHRTRGTPPLPRVTSARPAAPAVSRMVS